MDTAQLKRITATEWQIPATGRMRVPGTIFADECLVRAMDDKVRD
jgi:tRNA-splicing ligase RtcB (3'-phosphate/5'-hydroxy nucleic acid ligase)